MTFYACSTNIHLLKILYMILYVKQCTKVTNSIFYLLTDITTVFRNSLFIYTRNFDKKRKIEWIWIMNIIKLQSGKCSFCTSFGALFSDPGRLYTSLSVSELKKEVGERGTQWNKINKCPTLKTRKGRKKNFLTVYILSLIIIAITILVGFVISCVYKHCDITLRNCGEGAHSAFNKGQTFPSRVRMNF